MPIAFHDAQDLLKQSASRLDDHRKRLAELNTLLSQEGVAQDLDQLRLLSREQADVTEIVHMGDTLTHLLDQLRDTQALVSDPDMRDMAQAEAQDLERQAQNAAQQLNDLLFPADPLANRNAIVEIRAAAGGDEAGLFAGELYRMYLRFAEIKGWHVEQLTLSEGGIGQIKEVVFEVEGKGSFGTLRYESGVHRVQRVPATETQGRIHTSTATVAVLPVAEEVDIQIEDRELRIDIFHAGGAGGQNVNKVATAVRITHIPTNTVVVCQDERSQLKNRTKAMDVLRSRLLDAKMREQQESIASDRQSQIGHGDRSEKIRTYNFPQDRITDHRINQNWHNIESILAGNLDTIMTAMMTAASPDA
jgi:peptide chain release factor 1